METDHRVVVGDARSLPLEDDAVECVVTSPPYPMIDLWDEPFAELDPTVGDRLADDDGPGAFEAMHGVLDDVWAELDRVLVDGGIACVNVGDATRSLSGRFRVYQNHSRVIDAFEALGFDPLPELLWRKPVNSGTKFMGSGMVPPNAYVTLEHEYVLVFRKGPTSRSFEPKATRRYEAAYFWEERNRWFSDVWTDVTGEYQTLNREDLRERSAAFPFEIPYRLINMYSVYGDRVLDPFWGTGTTSLAAMVAGRDSVGVERDPAFTEVFDDRIADVESLSRQVARDRLDAHRAFVADHRAEGGEFGYEAAHYGLPVKTRQEESLRLYAVSDVREHDDEEGVGEGYRASHVPVEADDDPTA